LGGKSRLADKIIPQIPEHTCYCEPFCGAAWVFFRKPPSKVETTYSAANGRQATHNRVRPRAEVLISPKL